MKNNLIVIKPDHSSGSYSQAFGSKYLTTSFSAEWVTGWNSLWGQTSNFLLDAASWTCSECRIGLFLHLFLPMGFSRNFFTEKITCMTSSEHNRVSIPPQRSGIGLTDDRSCDSSQQLPFHSVIFHRFFCWKPASVHIN